MFPTFWYTSYKNVLISILTPDGVDARRGLAGCAFRSSCEQPLDLKRDGDEYQYLPGAGVCGVLLLLVLLSVQVQTVQYSTGVHFRFQAMKTILWLSLGDLKLYDTLFIYVCMYVWSSHIAEYGSTRKVANPARGQLNWGK